MIFISMYIMAMAIAAIMIHQLGIRLPTMLILSLTASYAVIFYNVINIHNTGRIYKKLFSEKWIVSVAMISAALMVTISFNVAILYGPAVHVFTFMAVTSAYGLLTAYFKNRQISDLVKFFIVLTILTAFYVIYAGGFDLRDLAKMLAMTTATGSFGYLYMIYSNRLSHLNCSASEILAMRYWVLLFIASALMLYHQQYHLINGTVLMQTLVLSLLFLVLPIYFLQKSIEKIGAHLSAIFMGLVPFVTFLLEKMTIGSGDRVTGCFSFVLAAVIIVPYMLVNFRRLRRKRSNALSSRKREASQPVIPETRSVIRDL